MDTVCSNDDEKEEMDDETKNWPINTKFQNELNLIKPLYCATPLDLYKNNVLIKPKKINDELKNSLIEVHFSIHHTHIGKERVNQDSFQAHIREVRILRQKKKPSPSEQHDPQKGLSRTTDATDNELPAKKKQISKHNKDNDDDENQPGPSSRQKAKQKESA